MFLGTLERVADCIDKPLANDTRTALEAALRYFRESAPKHTDDEEQSVFPRLRRCSHAEVETALAALDALEQEHRRADSLHAQVDLLGERCVQEGALSPAQALQFRGAVSELASIYKQHIRIEDEEIFPVTARILSPADKQQIAAEMAARRGVKVPADPS